MKKEKHVVISKGNIKMGQIQNYDFERGDVKY